MATPPTASEFLVDFPEFTGAPPELIERKIAHAVQRTDVVAWGDEWRLGVMTRTADLLAKSPQGRPLQLVNKEGISIYWDDLQTMVRRVAARAGRGVL